MEMETLDANQKPNVVADNVVVSLEYKLTVGGEVVDEADQSDPLEFLQGHKNIIPGLERELYGMSIGDKKSVTVAATDAYGEIDPQAFVEVPRDEFPPDIPLESGVQLQVRDTQGGLMDARIEKVGEKNVQLNFNHPLAGEDLHFEVSIADLRQATAEELEHGHVHGAHGHDDDEEFEFDDLEEDFDDEDFEDYDDDEDFEDEEYDEEGEFEEEGFSVVEDEEDIDEEK
jgi:FKBP-type peptidyl-prolyl cis-trans isomerase SlyD